jgi:hypothetical protein
MSHALERTSPKGGPSIGTCMKCGQQDIPLKQMGDECPNVANLTDDEALILAVKGPKP